jgi:hypothetical protein
VRFACADADLATVARGAVVVSAPARRTRDPELALAADGGSGVIGWQDFGTRTQEIRTSAFRCGP